MTLRGSDVVLRDGSIANIRPVVAADREALEAFLRGLDRDARLTRYNSLAISLAAEAARLATVDVNHCGLVAFDARRQAIVAHAEYIRSGPTTAEVAFANPLIARPDGALIVDARVRVAAEP